MYPPEMVEPLREELKSVGFQELLTPQEVDQALVQKGTTLVVVNSICGCAGGTARPGVALALQNQVIPDRLLTVFAGMERDAVDRVLGYHASAAGPSSPSMVLFKDGQVAAMVPRSSIEGRYPQDLARDLAAAFDQHCSKPGPSIPPEQFRQLGFAKMCGSSIPRRS
jgi:putative YphP/YqiW family bacilliredoxin